MADPIFRREALDHATAGERYEDLFVVVPSRAWTMLVAIGVLLVAAFVWSLVATIPVTVDGTGELIAGGGLQTLTAPADGAITDERSSGDAVTRNEAIARIRTSSLSYAVVRTPIEGNVIEVPHGRTTFVHRGDVVATIEPPLSSLQAIVFVPVATDRALVPGMPVRISPADANPHVYGVLRGTVVSVAPYPATPDRIASTLGNATLAAGLLSQPVREVHVALGRDALGEPQWSGFARSRPRVVSGTPVSAGVVVEDRHPIAFVFPPLR